MISDVSVTQSRSFQMLQGWISDSEKTVPTAVPPPSQTPPTNRSAGRSILSLKNLISFCLVSVARAVLDEQMGNTNRQANAGNTAAPPSRSFRYLQEQYNNGTEDNGAVTMTTTTTVEETVVSGDGVGLRRGSDSHMPSRAFKFLQDQYDAQKTPVNRGQGVNNREDLVEIYNKRERKRRKKIDFERNSSLI